MRNRLWKPIALLVILTMLAASLAACGATPTTPAPRAGAARFDEHQRGGDLVGGRSVGGEGE